MDKRVKCEVTQTDGEKVLLLEQGVRGHPDMWIHLQRQESTHVRTVTYPIVQPLEGPDQRS